MKSLVSCHKIYLEVLEICVLLKSLCCGKTLPCTLSVTDKRFGFLVTETKTVAWISTPIRPYSTKVFVICIQFFRGELDIFSKISKTSSKATQGLWPQSAWMAADFWKLCEIRDFWKYCVGCKQASNNILVTSEYQKY